VSEGVTKLFEVVKGGAGFLRPGIGEDLEGA